MICFLYFNNSKAQISIHSSFNMNYTGYNYRLGGEYFFLKHFSTGLGVKYLSWHPVTDNQGTIFKNRLRPNNFKESLGLYATFNYYPFKKNKHINPFLGYDFNFTKSSLIVHFYSFKGYLINPTTGEQIEVFELVEDYLTEPMIAIDNTLQIGFDAIIYKGLKLTQKVGGGLQNVYQVPVQFGPINGSFNFIWSYQVGLTYEFNEFVKKVEKIKPLPNKK